MTKRSTSKRTVDEIIDYQIAGQDKYNVNQSILQERDRLINYNKHYIKKHGVLPSTSLEFYKFVELIGKGAFGKVTLGIHKLTGRYVAIKTIDK